MSCNPQDRSTNAILWVVLVIEILVIMSVHYVLARCCKLWRFRKAARESLVVTDVDIAAVVWHARQFLCVCKGAADSPYKEFQSVMRSRVWWARFVLTHARLQRLSDDGTAVLYDRLAYVSVNNPILGLFHNGYNLSERQVVCGSRPRFEIMRRFSWLLFIYQFIFSIAANVLLGDCPRGTGASTKVTVSFGFTVLIAACQIPLQTLIQDAVRMSQSSESCCLYTIFVMCLALSAMMLIVLSSIAVGSDFGQYTTFACWSALFQAAMMLAGALVLYEAAQFVLRACPGIQLPAPKPTILYRHDVDRMKTKECNKCHRSMYVGYWHSEGRVVCGNDTSGCCQCPTNCDAKYNITDFTEDKVLQPALVPGSGLSEARSEAPHIEDASIVVEIVQDLVPDPGADETPVSGESDQLPSADLSATAAEGRAEQSSPAPGDTSSKTFDAVAYNGDNTAPQSSTLCSECGAALSTGQMDCTACGHTNDSEP